ncbi:hypothetical protein GH733_007854 [Mirounga leonina]|nr:hypothetical protein GH733_007854 [Mirounga leonina]
MDMRSMALREAEHRDWPLCQTLFDSFFSFFVHIPYELDEKPTWRTKQASCGPGRVTTAGQKEKDHEGFCIGDIRLHAPRRSEYGTSYGASLRKMVKKIEISWHTKYTCSFCGKTKMKRRAVGIWHHGSGMKTVAGGVWTYTTTSAVSEICHQNTEGVERPVEAPPFETLLAYNTWGYFWGSSEAFYPPLGTFKLNFVGIPWVCLGSFICQRRMSPSPWCGQQAVLVDSIASREPQPGYLLDSYFV